MEGNPRKRNRWRISCAVCSESMELGLDMADNLSTGNSPVDVMIRTGGEYRISNFLLWQLAYAELYIVDDFWPDFTFEKLKEALQSVSKRSRRFGK